MPSVGTHVRLPLSEEMTRTLLKALLDTLSEGYGTVEICITPQAVKIAQKSEQRFTWKPNN
jgi:hypothetical protein